MSADVTSRVLVWKVEGDVFTPRRGDLIKMHFWYLVLRNRRRDPHTFDCLMHDGRVAPIGIGINKHNTGMFDYVAMRDGEILVHMVGRRDV